MNERKAPAILKHAFRRRAARISHKNEDSREGPWPEVSR